MPPKIIKKKNKMSPAINKNLFNQIAKDPNKYATAATISQLEKVIQHAMDKYYNDTPVLSDEDYDILWDTLLERAPKSALLKKIGAPLRDEIEKVDLPYWLGSMSKVKPNSRELENWLKKYDTSQYFISEKLDGLSGLLVIKLGNNNKFSSVLYSRGNGSVGQDLSHLIPYVNLPNITIANYNSFIRKNKCTEIAVRGELIISINDFENKYKSVYPKARTMAASLVNSKTPRINELRDLKFVAYEMISPGKLSASNQFKLLKQLKFQVAGHKEIKTKLDTPALQDLLINMKESSPFEIDGIIVASNLIYPRNTSGNPKYAVAFKMQLSGQMKEAVVEKVIWNPSKHGVIVPTIQIKPVIIGGDKITKTTGFNAKYIKDNKIGAGAKLKMIKSGDVIPYILEVIKPASEPEMPDKDLYKWGDSGVDIYLKDMETSSAVQAKRLIHFFKTLSIPFLSEGTVNKLMVNGYSSIEDIYHLKKNEIAEMEGFQKKSATKLYDAIHNVMDHPIELVTLMTASNSFGTGFGVRKLRPLIDAIPDIMEQVSTIQIQDITDVEGFSDKSATAFKKGLKKFKKFLQERPFLKIKNPNDQPGMHINPLMSNLSLSKDNNDSSNRKRKRTEINDNLKTLLGKSVVMTGFRDTSIETYLLGFGIQVSSSVSGKTGVVIAKDPSSNSGKVKKAKDLGVTVIGIEAFKKKYL